MDIYDPNQWTVEFAKQKGVFCINFLKETNAKVIEKLREGNYKAAAAGIDRMLNGAVTLHNTGDYDMRPFLSTYSFNQGIIAVCGITDAPEEQRRQTAISAFSDARDFSTASLREISIGVINMLQSGQSLLSIKTEICPNFPSEIIGVMSDSSRIGSAAVNKPNAAAASTAASPAAPAAGNNVSGKKGGALKTVLLIIIPIAAIALIVFGYWLSGFINDNFSSDGDSSSRKEKTSNVRKEGETGSDENNTESSKQETSSYTNSGNNSSGSTVSNNTSSSGKPAGRQTTTYHVSTTSGLRLRYGPSLDNGIILEMPYLSTIEVYSIDGEWAYACFNGTDGYCSAEYISPGPGN